VFYESKDSGLLFWRNTNLKNTKSIVVFITLVIIFILGSSANLFAQDDETYNKYFHRRKFDAYSFGWDFKDEILDNEELPHNDYYYQVSYRNNDIIGFTLYYSNLEILSYTFPMMNNLTSVDKSESNIRRSIFYMNEDGKPVIIEKYKRGELVSIIRYDDNGKRRITETYSDGFINSVSYTNKEDKPALRQVYENLKLISTEIVYYDDNGNDKFNIMVYEDKALKYITGYKNGVRYKVWEYKDNVLDKIYYYDETGLLYKYELYQPGGNIMYSYDTREDKFPKDDDEADKEDNNTNNKEDESDEDGEEESDGDDGDNDSEDKRES
jgi:hypothetical protein